MFVISVCSSAYCARMYVYVSDVCVWMCYTVYR